MWIGICKLVDIPEKQGENVTYWKNHCGESWKWEEARGGGVWRRAQTLVVRVTSPRDPPPSSRVASVTSLWGLGFIEVGVGQ